ncbi:MAG: class I SAM-dependent methyltransferase [Verrucomicrobia bacterium]|nr:class I SAM-dependent methyltransferase [Verrucomicrobiota bacterium]
MKSAFELAPLLYPGMDPPLTWLMSHAERLALLGVLEAAQPAAALEVGTAGGGSLQQIRRFAPSVYSVDIVPSVRERLAPLMPNVEFLTGDSRDLIGTVLARCTERGTPLGFALIDGDHSYGGVNGDVRALLAVRPRCPLWVLMHDSSNPDCRAGIADAPWADNPHVHAVELDFVIGALSEDPQFQHQLWGGFALALLLPEPRTHSLAVTASGAKSFAALWRASAHYPSLQNKVSHWLQVKRRGIARRLGRTRSVSPEP